MRNRASTEGEGTIGTNGLSHSHAGDGNRELRKQLRSYIPRFPDSRCDMGADIASLKGKTTKRATPSADITVNAKIVQQDQILAINIMFIDKTATLISVATP